MSESTQSSPKAFWSVGGLCAAGAFLCVFLSVSALFLLFETVSIDFDGSIEERYKPYEILINGYFILGLIAVPLGIALGAVGCYLCKKERAVAVLPILIQGAFLCLLTYNIVQNSFGFGWGGDPPIAVPVSTTMDLEGSE